MISSLSNFQKEFLCQKQNNRDLTLVPKEDIEKLSVSITNFDENELRLRPPQWMVNEAISNGESYVSWQPDQSLIQQRRKLFAEMHSFATIPLGDTLPRVQSLEPLNEKSLQFDYEYLVSRPVREMIQREFSFELKDLSIQEQFYFLNYLKHTTVETAETMKYFIANFGIDAMRAFLINQHDENASENIMITGIMYEENAKPLFKAYAEILDAGDQFAKQLRENTKSADIVSLMDEFQDGLLKRAGHLFSASKKMGQHEYAEDHGLSDVEQSFEGIQLMQEVLARIGHDDTLTLKRSHAREGSKNPLHDAGSETFYYELADTKNGEQLSLKVFVRPVANSEGEARVNFELHLDKLPETSELKKAFTQTTVFKDKKKTVTQSVIRFGFDLDSKTSPSVFSFDMGRGAYVDTQMERTGDALGNILGHVAPEGSHMTDFSPKFSDPETFKRLAFAFKEYFKSISSTEEVL